MIDRFLCRIGWHKREHLPYWANPEIFGIVVRCNRSSCKNTYYYIGRRDAISIFGFCWSTMRVSKNYSLIVGVEVFLREMVLTLSFFLSFAGLALGLFSRCSFLMDDLPTQLRKRGFKEIQTQRINYGGNY